MKTPRIAIAALATVVAALVLLPSAGQSTAVGTAFTYQGRLDRSGPVNGSVNFQFTLYDAATGGRQFGAAVTVNGVAVVSGLFTVSLDFGPGSFTGLARWLEISVQGPGDGGFILLSPRQAISAAPYALFSLGGNTGFTLPFASEVAGATQSGFEVDNTAPTGLVHGIVGKTYSSTPNAAGIQGEGLAGLSATSGVQGYAINSPLGIGVVGHGGLNGGYFESISPNGCGSGAGVEGFALNTLGVKGYSAACNGVYGESGANGVAGVSGFNSLNGIGVYGQSGTYGVEGRSTNGAGVFGNSAGGYAVYGSSTNNYGVYGTSSNSAGVYGKSFGSAPGIYGLATAASTAAVYGLNQDAGTAGQGVYGYGSVGAVGVQGTSDGNDGVSGKSTAPGKSGVVGVSTDNTGFGGFFTNTALGGVALRADGLAQVKTLQILGADLAESFPVREAHIEPGTVLVLDDASAGQLRISDAAYSTRVAGVVSGANGLDAAVVLKGKNFDATGHAAVALSGRVWVKCDATRAPIHTGDLLTTSDLAGYAMKASDRDRAYGAILGKAMTSLETGTGMILVLVSLQ